MDPCGVSAVPPRINQPSYSAPKAASMRWRFLFAAARQHGGRLLGGLKNISPKHAEAMNFMAAMIIAIFGIINV